jgi:mannose-1-phosphate guanylyltransferase
VTLYLTPVEDPRAYGLVPTDHAGRVTAFLEKPKTEDEIVTNNINAGCYVFKRGVIDQIPAGRPVSVERETFPGLLAADALVTGVVDSGYWLDLGTPLSFVQGSCDLVLGAAPSPAVPTKGDFLALESSTIADSANVHGGTCVGRGAVIADLATVNGAVVFDGAERGRTSSTASSVWAPSSAQERC